MELPNLRAGREKSKHDHSVLSDDVETYDWKGQDQDQQIRDEVRDHQSFQAYQAENAVTNLYNQWSPIPVQMPSTVEDMDQKEANSP